MELKGEMSMLNVLRLEDIDMEKMQSALEKKRDEAPQFFAQSPIVVDCSAIVDKCSDIDFVALKETILELGFIPVGVRGTPDNINASLMKSGWAVMRPGQAPASAKTEKENEQSPDQGTQKEPQQQTQEDATPQQAAAPSVQSMTIDKPVRSGQQVYAANGDMTILSATSAGSELVADGSIHAYGPMRGRVLAGARGNESARIFCNSLQAELIAIAGRYLLLDESNTELKGKPAMIRLEGEKLVIEPLN